MRTRRLIVQGPDGERELLFVGRLTVGRAPECDISVADTKISRRHAEFDATGPTPRVADLGSRNGLLVNGRKVNAADLSPGDEVTIGDLRIRFEETVPVAPPPARMTATADRTAVLPMPTGPAGPTGPGPVTAPPAPAAAPVVAPPAAPPLPVDPAAGSAAAAAPVDLSASDDRTAVLPRAAVAPQPPPAAEGPAAEDKTTVLPRPSAPPGPAGPSSAPAPAPAARVEEPAAPSVAPPPVAPAPRTSPPRAATPPPPGPVATDGMAVPSPPPAPVRQPEPAVAARESQASAVSAPAADASSPAARGPRFSWGGLVILVCVALGGLGVLLGALPLMSASSTTIDQLSRRQVRTLGGWVGSAVRPDGAVDERVLADVLSQPGVESVVVLDRATGRAMAPERLLGRTFETLPVVGTQWRSFSAPQVTVSTGYADAFVPVEGGTAGYVAWVRYAPPQASENGVAVIVGLLSTLVLALLMATIIRRHTATTLQHFTRQVELVVSGANPKVMDGKLLPGVDRLPGVITYLLEQRRAQAAVSVAAAVAESVARGDVRSTAAAAGAPDARVTAGAGPAWVVVTPSLSVVETSAEAPAAGVRDWASASGRHLLDVLEPGPVCNAVVQGLGTLGLAAGSEVAVPVPGQPSVTLRREPSTHVRVELAVR